MKKMTQEEALAYIDRNEMRLGDDGLPLMPDKDSVPADVWRDCQAAYQALSGGKVYHDPSIPAKTHYIDPSDNQY